MHKPLANRFVVEEFIEEFVTVFLLNQNQLCVCGEIIRRGGIRSE